MIFSTVSTIMGASIIFLVGAAFSVASPIHGKLLLFYLVGIKFCDAALKILKANASRGIDYL